MANEVVSVIDEREVLGKEFRIYGTVEAPIFLARDVAEWIGYSVSNVSKMLKSVDEDEKTTRTISTNGTNYTTEAWFLTEDGLYEVLMQSRKPIAKQFKKKVKEILKEIRKTGQYIAKPMDSYMIEDPIERAKVWIKEEEKRIALTAQVKTMLPKAECYDKFVDCSDGVIFRVMVQQSGCPNERIARKILVDNHFCYDRPYFDYNGKIHHRWFACHEAIRKGWVKCTKGFAVEGHEIPKLTYTMEGQKEFYRLVRESGVALAV